MVNATQLESAPFQLNNAHRLIDDFTGIEAVTAMHPLYDRAQQYVAQHQQDAFRILGAREVPPEPPQLGLPTQVTNTITPTSSDYITQIVAAMQTLNKPK
jgi:hypothetical protein